MILCFIVLSSFCILLYTCANVICIKFLLTYLLTYLTIFWLSTYGVHISATWQMRLNHTCASAMRPSVRLLWPPAQFQEAVMNVYVPGRESLQWCRRTERSDTATRQFNNYCNCFFFNFEKAHGNTLTTLAQLKSIEDYTLLLLASVFVCVYSWFRFLFRPQ